MKAMFLIFHGFEAANGISKKIGYQVEALRECGLDVHTCYLTDDADGHKRRMIDGRVLRDYGSGLKAKILKRTEWDSLVEYVKEEKISLIYVRYDHNASPFTICLMRRLKRTGARIALEIPTYPYDREYTGLPWAYQRILFFDRCFRKMLVQYVDKIVTFSNHRQIWNRPTIGISNGIDFAQISVKQQLNDTRQQLHLIAVATMHPWHGFDRAIAGMAAYYEQYPQQELPELFLHIVGQGIPALVAGYVKEVADRGLEAYVLFHGAQFGEPLDRLFDQADIGIGSLARHRSGIDRIKTLKNREYAARGIPFVYSETDEDFEQMPYVMKVPADDSPLDMEQIIAFYRQQPMNPSGIRASIEHSLSWRKQMQRVINEME